MKRVLVTGAAGRLGRCLWQAWEKAGHYDLTLVDKLPVEGARSRVEVGDLFDRDFTDRICVGQDVVVALAYVASEEKTFAPGAGTDIAMNMQLFEACRRAAVGRIVFASSNHATGWNEQTRERHFLSSPEEYNPTGWYGAMKGMAELAGKALGCGHSPTHTGRCCKQQFVVLTARNGGDDWVAVLRSKPAPCGILNGYCISFDDRSET